MKECAFTPTAEEAAAIQAAYVRMAVMQVVRRENSARMKKNSNAIVPSWRSEPETIYYK